MQDQSPAPAAPPGLRIERATAGDELVGYRLRCGNNTLLAFEDQGAMPGFRLGDNFVGAFTGPKIEYAPVGLASPPAVMPAAPSDAVKKSVLEAERWIEGIMRGSTRETQYTQAVMQATAKRIRQIASALEQAEPAAGEQAGAVACSHDLLLPNKAGRSEHCVKCGLHFTQFHLAAPGAAIAAREQDDPFECYAKGIASMINTSGGLSQAQGDWDIDHSAGRPILMYKKCSVIEAEDAEYVLRLIAADRASREEAPATPPAAIPAAPSDALRIHHEWSIRHMPGYSEDGDERVAYRATVLALTQPTTVQQPVDNDERVTRAVRELILLRHCLSYNASYCGETAGRVKQDVAGWERQGAKPLTFSEAGLSRLAAAVKGGAA